MFLVSFNHKIFCKLSLKIGLLGGSTDDGLIRIFDENFLLKKEASVDSPLVYKCLDPFLTAGSSVSCLFLIIISSISTNYCHGMISSYGMSCMNPYPDHNYNEFVSSTQSLIY